MTWAVGVLVATGLLVAAGPGGRPVGAGRASAGRAEVGAAEAAPGSGSRARPGGSASSRAAWLRARAAALGLVRHVEPGARDLAGAITTVCTLLRAGAQPADAWARALRLPACGPVPTVAQLLVRPGDAAGGRRRPSADEVGRARAVVAAAVVAGQLGAPLATVLDEVAAAVVADAEAEAELAAALSGPRASVRVLLGLPVLGVLLGAALGADPLGVLLDGGLGTVAGVLGCGLALTGWCWTRALIGRARRAASS